MKTPKEILDKIIDDSSWVLSENLIEEIIYPSMIKYGKQQYNKAVLDCAENATTECTSTCIRVDKDSMLKLLKE